MSVSCRLKPARLSFKGRGAWALARVGAALVGVVAGAAGCAMETRVVRYEPMLSSLPGAVSNTPVVRDRPRSVLPEELQLPGDRRREVDAMGNVTLHARSPFDVFVHVRQCLLDGDRQLLADQVLSEQTRHAFIVRGRDPTEAWDMLMDMEREIAWFGGHLQLGQSTPSARQITIGRNQFRWYVAPERRDDFGRINAIDVVFEDGNMKLLWFEAVDQAGRLMD